MSGTEKKKTLVVEDERLTTELAKAVPEKHDFSIIIEEEGGTALSLARRESPDLTLLDAILPTIDLFTV